jgi:hypothetical protein
LKKKLESFGFTSKSMDSGEIRFGHGKNTLKNILRDIDKKISQIS